MRSNKSIGEQGTRAIASGLEKNDAIKVSLSTLYDRVEFLGRETLIWTFAGKTELEQKFIGRLHLYYDVYDDDDDDDDDDE